jgi:hypothetical protein
MQTKSSGYYGDYGASNTKPKNNGSQTNSNPFASYSHKSVTSAAYNELDQIPLKAGSEDTLPFRPDRIHVRNELIVMKDPSRRLGAEMV